MKGAADVALTFAIAGAGGLIASLVGLPVPWLIGSAIFAAAASLWGVPIRQPRLVRDAAFVVLGSLAGSSVTPEVLSQMALWPFSFVIQMLGVFGVIAATMVFLPVSEFGPASIALFCGAVLACALVGERLRLPGGLFVGALLASAVLHGADVVPVAIPEPLVLLGLLSVGVLIGSRVRHEHRSLLFRLLPASLSALAIGFAMAALSGIAAHLLLGIELGPIAVAYAPGALEALVAIAYQFDVDPAYVAAHHVVRFIALSIAIPILARWLAGGPAPAVAKGPPAGPPAA